MLYSLGDGSDYRPAGRVFCFMQPDKAKRLVDAVEANLDNWIEQVTEIEANANPGNKLRSLHLLKSLQQAKSAIKHIREDAER